jgi:hypothetical protein
MLVPGATGQKSTFPDGLQVDHLSENTVGHGTRVKGISDPTTYPVIAGDVGETVEANGTESAFTTAKDLTNFVTLTPGVWLLNGYTFGNSSTGATVMIGRWKIKGAIGGVPAKDASYTTAVSTERTVFPMPSRVITVSPADADKTVKINLSNSISQSVDYYIMAVRIA